MPQKQYETVITDHHITLNIDGGTEILAYCWIEVNKSIRINGLKIIHLNGSLQIKWPMNGIMNASYCHIVHPIPIGNNFREEVEKNLLEDYLRMVDDEKIWKMSADLESLKQQKKKTLEKHQEISADALEKAIENLNKKIQQRAKSLCKG